MALFGPLLCASLIALAALGAQAALVLTTLYSFRPFTGVNPEAGLVQGSDGYLCTSDLSSAVSATGAALNSTDSVTTGPQRFYRLVLAFLGF